MIGKFFHIPQPQRFYIPPRYHNPNVEARDDREKRIKEELGIIDEKIDVGKPFMPNIKGQFRMAHGAKFRSTKKTRQSSNTKLIVLILILTLIFYLFFYSDFSF